MIRFNNVTATYPNGSGIYDISFEVNKSEMLFLMGPTGSGKSTLLKAIYKGIAIDSGELYVDNENISRLQKAKILPPPPQNHSHLYLQRFITFHYTIKICYTLLYTKKLARNIRTGAISFI